MKIIYLITLSFFLNSFLYADKNMKIGHKGKLEDVDRTIIVKMYDRNAYIIILNIITLC